MENKTPEEIFGSFLYPVLFYGLQKFKACLLLFGSLAAYNVVAAYGEIFVWKTCAEYAEKLVERYSEGADYSLENFDGKALSSAFDFFDIAVMHVCFFGKLLLCKPFFLPPGAHFYAYILHFRIHKITSKISLKIKTYKYCPKKYYFRYIENINIPQSNSKFERGKKIHALANYKLQGINIDRLETSLNKKEKEIWATLQTNDFYNKEFLVLSKIF